MDETPTQDDGPLEETGPEITDPQTETVPADGTGNEVETPAPLVAKKIGAAKLLAIGGAVALVIVGAIALTPESGPESALDPTGGQTTGPKTGFALGDLPADEPIERITVTLRVGSKGQDLAERVDLHLGTGFPLRLFPLGNDSRDPAFAAFPQKSSLADGVTSIPAGGSASFEFSTSGEEGLDVLGTTSTLLDGLVVGDIKGIGFASLAESDWVLEGYRIEVNGKLFAENDSVDASATLLVGEARRELLALRPESEVLLREIADLKTFVATGLGSDQDKSDLAEKEARMKEIAGPLNLLAGEGAGYYPWYVEEDKKLAATTGAGEEVGEISVSLSAGGGDDPGTRNPLYLRAGGKRFLLTSESDPLVARDTPQEFTISLADLKFNPTTKADLGKIGLGVVGNEEPFGAIPDRAKIQRVVVTLDGESVYDSELKIDDRRTLQAYWLVPPAHFDHEGGIIRNAEKPTEKHVWLAGMPAPIDPLQTGGDLTPEAPLLPSGLGGLTPLPEGLPGLTGGLPGSGLPGSGLPGSGLPGSGLPGSGLPGSGLPGLTGTTPPGGLGTVPPPLPAGPGGLTGGGLGTTPPPLTGLTTGTPSGPGLSPLPGGGLSPNPGSFAPGGGAATPPVTTLTGSTTGTFVPSGQVDPATGLLQGTLQRTGLNGFTPIRGTGSFGGLNPGVFNPITATGLKPGGLTPAQISQIASAILNVLKLTPAQPTPLNPVAPPTLGQVSFPNTTSAVEIGRKSVVDWTILGNTAGAVGIASFRIDLLPVLPHLTPPVPAGSKPLASTTADANARTVAVPPIVLPTSGGLPGIPAADLPLLYVQPVVTALDDKGNTVGTALDGPILPLLPDPTTYSPQGVRFALSRGIGAPPVDDPASQTGGSFQVIRAAGNKSDSWKALGLVRPTVGETDTAAMLGFREEGALSANRFAPTEIQSPSMSFNSAARTRSGDVAVVVFEGGLTYPKRGGVLAPAGKSGAPRGYRLVGHLGFLSGATPGAGSADVQMRVELSGAGTTFSPTIVCKLNGDHVVDAKLEKSAYLRIETTAPITLNKVAGGAMQEFDIPISFEALDKGLGAVYPGSRPTASFGALPMGSNVADPSKHLTLPMTTADFDAYKTAKNQGGSFGVTVTVMIDSSKAGPDDSVGIFGLRLVPDVY